jgi:hypothetical protein
MLNKTTAAAALGRISLCSLPQYYLRQPYRDCSLGTAGRFETSVVSKLLSPEGTVTAWLNEGTISWRESITPLLEPKVKDFMTAVEFVIVAVGGPAAGVFALASGLGVSYRII